MKYRAILTMVLMGLAGCRPAPGEETAMEVGSFADDVAFLGRHVETLVLETEQGTAQVAVVPAWQGRIATSTNQGPRGRSFGWINRELVASGKTQPHINVFGGEDRFWLGPEGGQYSIFFAPGDPFDLEHWQTPAAIDTEPFELVESTPTEARFRREFSLTNYSGFRFDLRVDRTVHILSRREAATALGGDLPESLAVVSHETRNLLTNIGSETWTQERGLLSIWILGMFNPSDRTTVLIPYRGDQDDPDLGPVVNDAYFGRVPDDRLIVRPGMVFFRGDGRYRSKIGLSPHRALDILGSWDGAGGTLTVAQYNRPEDSRPYVNSMWEIQDDPYAGDAVNSYNDGPPSPGAKPLGPFYELETSSPAAELGPGESLLHVHRTTHLTGDRETLAQVLRILFGKSPEEIPW